MFFVPMKLAVLQSVEMTVVLIMLFVNQSTQQRQPRPVPHIFVLFHIINQSEFFDLYTVLPGENEILLRKGCCTYAKP